LNNMVSKAELARAIREKCAECMCGSRDNVTLCTSRDCPLWEYRTAKKLKYEKEK